MLGNASLGNKTLGNLISPDRRMVDIASGVDSALVDHDIFPEDQASGADVLTLFKDFMVSDSGAGAEALMLDKSLLPSDAATGGETLSVPSKFLSPARLRDGTRLAPVYLVEISLLNGGPTLYLSDRNVYVALLGLIYEDYLDDLGGLGEELRRADSGGLNSPLTLRFSNLPFGSHAHLIELGETYPFEGAGVTVRECYMEDGAVVAVAEVIFAGALDEPREIDLAGFTCRVSSAAHAKDRGWSQARVSEDDYPNAYEDLGAIVPIVYGGPFRIPALRTDWGARTTLAADITASSTSMQVSDPSRFPASGYLWADGEKVYFEKSGSSFLARGQGGTSARAHNKGAVLWEHRSQYDSVLSDHELKAVSAIYAEVAGYLLRVTSGVSALMAGGRHILRATEQITVSPSDDQSNVYDALGVSDNIAVTVGGSGKTIYPSSSDGNMTDPAKAYDGNEATYASHPGAGAVLTVNFPTTNYGTIQTQHVWAKLLGDGNVAGQFGQCTGWSPSTFSLGSAGWVRFTKSGGGWGDCIRFEGTGDFLNIYEVRKEVEYTAEASKAGAAYRSGSVTKTGEVVVSMQAVERFHADVEGAKDPDGGYGGVGSLIERPDYVVRHFLIERMGVSAGDIDEAAFVSAGASFAAAGYKFAFAVDGEVKPSEFIRRLAKECRSTLAHRGGKWRLDFLPSAAPAAVKTITKGELAGEGAKFVFDRTSVLDLKNDIEARYRRAYSRVGSGSEWDATCSALEEASVSKYGGYPGEVELTAVRDQAMAEDVLAHMLLQAKTPLLRVRFPVFYEHFDLEPGDTIEIDNTLFDGRKFYIEEIRRMDKFRAEVRAVEWWA